MFDYRPGDVFGCVADIGWITGHSYVVYGPLCNGATSVLFESTPVYPDAGADCRRGRRREERLGGEGCGVEALLGSGLWVLVTKLPGGRGRARPAVGSHAQWEGVQSLEPSRDHPP